MESESSSSELLGQDLSCETLSVYLKEDPTFVEYLNSFLLLPAFSNKLFYNKDTGYFEQVHSDGKVCWDNNVTPSSSMVTLYLPEDTIGASLDKEQSCQWISQHRLPLFLRSDLYSEYKISKLLTRPLPFTKSAASHSLVSTDSNIRPQSSAASLGGKSAEQRRQEDTKNFPELIGPHAGGDGARSKKTVGVVASRSNIELELRPKKTVKWHRSLSMDLEDLTLLSSAKDKRSSASTSVAEQLMNARAMQYLSSKCGMSALWKFLQGTAGERNWLFWLDAERIKYYSSREVDQHRLIKDLRERYLHCGSPLELPPETRMRVKLSKCGNLTIDQIESLQEAMIERLREYWCPRFLLHRYKERRSSSVSTVSPVLKLFQSSPSAQRGIQDLSDLMTPARNHTRPITPLTPTRTPTYLRLGKPRPKPSTPTHADDETKETDRPVQTDVSTDTEFEKPSSASAPLLSDFVRTADDVTSMASVKSSRTVWRKGSITPEKKKEGDATSEGSMLPDTVLAEHSPKHIGRSGQIDTRTSNRLASSATRFSKLAKYATHHLPHPDSKCGSRMEGTVSSSSICKSHCQILSVSGTPVQSVTSLETADSGRGSSVDTPKVCYDDLLRCLAMENRKAGGYFLSYLEQLDNSVYINCLQFWREVQEFKYLFIQDHFSPCTVELKSKAVFGYYISECCSSSIGCPPEVVRDISANLWPAYEDLFDEAEEHALHLLYLRWKDLSSSEEDEFQKLNTVELSLSIEGQYSVSDGFADEIDGMSFSSNEATNYAGDNNYTTDDLFLPLSQSYMQGDLAVCDSSQSVNLQTVLNDPTELEHFKVFLNDNCAAEDLMCWMDIEAFRGIPAFDKSIRRMKAKQLRKRYFTKQYYFGPNSPATKDEQRQAVMAGGGQYGARLPARPRTPVFREAQKHVQSRLEKAWLVKFINTPEFLERNRGTRLFRAGSYVKTAMKWLPRQPSVAEHSFVNSHQAILFRKYLMVRKPSDHYLRFMKIKAIHEVSTLGIKYPKEDLHFWYEVQKYKQMYHVHTNESTLDSKVTAIIDCFFESSVPPQLQIDVPLSLAELVTRKPGGPYLFRETQAAIFKLLYGGWKEFRTFSSGLDNRQLKRALDKMERNARESKRAKRLHEERMKQEEESRRRMLPHFETAEERELRLKQEKELEEFGKAAVEFSLSSPDPSYVYYTVIPEDQSVLEIVDRSSFDSSDTSSWLEKPTPTPSEIARPKQERLTLTPPTKRVRSGKKVGARRKAEARKKHVVDKTSIVKMTLEGKAPGPGPPRKFEPHTAASKLRKQLSHESRLSESTIYRSRQPSPRDFSDTPRWSSPCSSRLSLRPSAKDVRKPCPGQRKRSSKEESALAKNMVQPSSTNTIRMQVSGIAGKPYAYGGGLPEDQSYLTITNTTNLAITH